MKTSYQKYQAQISKIKFEDINQNVIKLGYPALKQENYQLQVTLKDNKLKDSPWLNNKQPFDNKENLYLRVVDLMKMFIRFEEKDFLKYAYANSNFTHIANKIQILRLHNPQFQILLYLIKRNSRKLIALYIKLRQQIITRCGLNTTKFNPISLHNATKNFNNENVELGPIKIDYLNWGVLAQITKSKISQDMLWWITEGNRKINAVDFVRVCLWAHQNNIENPETQ